MAENARIRNRSEIEDKYKWKLDDIYPDVQAWEAEFPEMGHYVL